MPGVESIGRPTLSVKSQGQTRFTCFERSQHRKILNYIVKKKDTKTQHLTIETNIKLAEPLGEPIRTS